jgi:hypothetical protein
MRAADHASVDTEVTEQIVTVAGRIAELTGSLPSTGVTIPGASWTVGEAAAHLVLANGLMTAIAEGRPSPYGDGTKAGLAAANAQSLIGYPERDAAVLAARLNAQAGAFVEAARRRTAADVVDTPLGPLTVDLLSRYVLAHQLSHGTAIAAALRQAPLVRPRHVPLVLPFVLATMPRLIDRAVLGDLRASYEIRVRGVARFTAVFGDGHATITDQRDRQPDCVISADPVSFFLLAAGLASQWRLIARGRLRAWGRRPWLALQFRRFFAIP